MTIIYENFGGANEARLRSPSRTVNTLNEGVILRSASRGLRARSGDVLRMSSPRRALFAVSGQSAAVLVSPQRSAYANETALLPEVSVAYLASPSRGVIANLRVTHALGGAVSGGARRALVASSDVAWLVSPARTAVAMTYPVMDSYFSIYQSPGIAEITSGAPKVVVRVSDGMSAGEAIDLRLTVPLGSGVALQGEPVTVLEAISRLSDSVEMIDAIGAIWNVLLASGFDVDADAQGSALIATRLAEVLGLLSGAGSALSAHHLVASAIALNDVLAVLTKEQLSDQVAFNAAFNSALQARQALLDSVVIESTANHSALLTAVITDEVELTDSPRSLLEAMNTLSDGIASSMTLRIGDSVYVAWVCNTQNKAFARYENYPFNSFFEMGGKYYGVAPDGLYELEGDDDDGEPISARVRTGLWNLNTGKQKRIPSLYLGYESTGRMVLKVITTSERGEKEENWYALKQRSGDAMHEGRIKIGRGLKSVYWGFELCNIDGADFSLDALELFPMILDRRVNGGSA